MCGILGFSGRYPVDETKLRWLFDLNQSRGEHSSGVFTIKSDKKHTQTLLKSIKKASDFINEEELKDALRGATSVIGHTRQATWGAVSKENAHPFQFGEVVGVHNGFIIQELRERYGIKETLDVDSMMIFAYLEKHGGDYTKLKDLEGAITTAYMVTEKYPDVVHLYRRTARELHFGYTKEGIYFSSEKGPLEKIGCRNVTAMPNLQMILLRNGDIIDSVECESPVINLPLGTVRSNWKDKASKLEYEKYEELKDKVTTIPAKTTKSTSTYYSSRSKRGPGYDFEGNQSELFRSYTNMIGSLVKEVEDDIKYVVAQGPPDFEVMTTYEHGDMSSCLVLFKLCNSGHKNSPLPGFIFYDKVDPRICGVSALNGVALLKYASQDCEKKRTIVVADPVDGNSKWEFILLPEQGRVMEVTLQLPFPQKEEIKTAELPFESKADARNAVITAGNAQLSLLPAVVRKEGGFLANPGTHSQAVQGPKSAIHSRFETEQVFGKLGFRGEDSGNTDRNSGEGFGGNVRTGNGLKPITKDTMEMYLAFSQLVSPIEKSAVQKRVDFSRMEQLLVTELGKIIDVPKILEDATIIKVGDHRMNKSSWAIPVYVLRLLEVKRIQYLKMNMKITNTDNELIEDFINLYRQGHYLKTETEGTSKKKTTSDWGTAVHSDKKWTRWDEKLIDFFIGPDYAWHLLEFRYLHKFKELDLMPKPNFTFYTNGQKLALQNVITLHNAQMKRSIQNLKEVHEFLGEKATLSDHGLLEKVLSIRETLENLRTINEGLLKQIEGEGPNLKEINEIAQNN